MNVNAGHFQVPIAVGEEQRRDLARVVTILLERWALPTDTQLALLGMSPESRRLLTQYRRGERALPNTRDTLDRVGYLLRIHTGLRLLFPEDEALRYKWVSQRNRLLAERSPLDVMLEEGLVGLARVARLIEFQSNR